jgi:hypothetical protein
MNSKKIKKTGDLTEIDKKKFSKNNSSKKAIKNSKEISASEEPLTKIIENPEDLFINNTMKISNILE